MKQEEVVKRIVTTDGKGVVVSVVEHVDVDPNAEQKQRIGDIRFGICLGVIGTVLIFAAALSRFRF